MKKFVYIFATLLFCVTQANAQKLYIEDCDAPQGGVVTISVKYSTDGVKCEGAQMNLDLPEGLSFVTDENGDAVGTINPDIAKGFTLVTSKNGFAVYGTGSYTGEGTLLTFDLNVSSSLSIGDVKEVTVRNLSIPTADADIPNDPFTFKVTIVENRVTLDENSTTAPEAAENVNVLVKRSVKSGNWGTICLPFDMTPEQMTAAFGEGVALADFNDYDVVEEGEGKNAELVGITVKFNTVTTGIAKNHPYILKATQNITYEEGFKVENVSIDPAEPDDLEINLNTSRKPHSIIGTYVPATIDELCLFLSGNKFYYSTGKTKIKGFRAWFNFDDILTEVDDVYGAKVSILVDGESTTIDGMGYQRIVEGVYDLSGRKIQLQDGDLNKLQKGVYIIDGKKVTIK